MFKDRIKKIRSNLKNHNALLVSQSLNIFYITGFEGFSKEEREGFLLITKNKNYVLTDARYKEAVEKSLSEFKFLEIQKSKRFSDHLKEIVKTEKINKLLISESDIKVSEYKKISNVVKITSDENVIEKLREVKDELEILNLKKASKLGDEAFKYILKEIKLGVTEIEIAQKIIIFILSHNTQVSFDPIVAFGENSSSPHHVPTNKKLAKNSIVLLDFGVKINNYCSDMTRTIFFGKATKEQKNIYNVVLNSQKKAFEYILNNKSAKTNAIDKVARDFIVSNNFATIPHSLGHGIGLEVHESPRLSPKSKEKLEKGMVFSIEPGIYIPNFGGVRIEDLYLYNGKNTQLISHANKGIIEL